MGNSKIYSIENKIRRNVPLSGYSTFKVGGPADYFIEIEDEDEFRGSILWALKNSIQYFILGRGANVLISDNGFKGLIIFTGKYNRVRHINGDIVAQCGVLVDSLVDYATEKALTGVEFLAGMPGTVGGAVYMNARAYGGEISGVIKEASVLNVDSKKGVVEKILLNNEEMGFSYKDSIFQKGNIYLLEARFELKKGNFEEIKKKVTEIRTLRKEKGEYLFPSAGCIFKNDYSIGKSSGKLIDECRLKGVRIGDAEVYEKHANFIVNKGKAKAEDIYKLICLVEKKVKEETGIRLKREIILVGFDF